MNRIISTFLIFFILFWSISFSYAEEVCKYTSKIEECDKSTSKLSIEEFICIEWSRENMIYNIILDDKFKKIDKEADEYLDNLEKAKSQYFWPDQKETFFTWVDQIEASFWINWYFYNKYLNIVPEIISETVTCNWKTQNWTIKDYFPNSLMIQTLVIKKIEIRKQVAYDIMNLNKQTVRKDEKKRYVQEKRTHYDVVSNLFMINLWYLIRILNKWASKTRNPLQ